MGAEGMPSDEHRGHWLRRVARGLAVLILGLAWGSYHEIKHPSTTARVIHLVLGIVLLAGLVVAFISDLPDFVRWGREARDWLWLRRQDWRDWRERRAGRLSA
jgi:hypothetical protein